MIVQKGDQGQKVLLLQGALVEIGISLSQYGIDGIYGLETEQAVRQAQSMYGLPPTGKAGLPLLKQLGLAGEMGAANRSGSSNGIWIIALLTIGVLGASIHESRKKK